MSKACVFLADGFEEVEGLTVVDLLRRAGVKVETVSIMKSKSNKVEGRSKIMVHADVMFEEASFKDVDLLVLPGGMPGTTYLGEHKGLRDLLLEFNRKEKLIAAICAAPTVLGKNGILDGKRAAVYPGLENQLGKADVVIDEEVVTDGHVTTSRGAGTAIPFALELIRQLEGEETAETIRKSIVYETTGR